MPFSWYIWAGAVFGKLSKEVWKDGGKANRTMEVKGEGGLYCSNPRKARLDGSFANPEDDSRINRWTDLNSRLLFLRMRYTWGYSILQFINIIDSDVTIWVLACFLWYRSSPVVAGLNLWMLFDERNGPRPWDCWSNGMFAGLSFSGEGRKMADVGRVMLYIAQPRGQKQWRRGIYLQNEAMVTQTDSGARTTRTAFRMAHLRHYTAGNSGNDIKEKGPRRGPGHHRLVPYDVTEPNL